MGKKVDIQVSDGGLVRMPSSGGSGISALTGTVPITTNVANGEVVTCKAVLPQKWVNNGVSMLEMKAHIADAEGWTVLSG